MALIKCPECSREISDKAKSCPHCGNPMAAKLSARFAVQPPRGGTYRYGWLFFIILFFVTLYFSNPSYGRHRMKIKDALEQSHPIASLFGMSQLAAMATGYHSVGIGSYTEFNGRVVSVGALGVVVVFD